MHMTNLRTKVESIIKEELSGANIVVPWDMREIHVLPHSKCVVEHTKRSAKRSGGHGGVMGSGLSLFLLDSR